MDNSNYHSYPYVCKYLWHLWNIEKLTGKQILDRVLDIQDWLDSSCILTGKQTFIWDVKHILLPLNSNIDTQHISRTEQVIYISEHIYFSNEQDLLAFKLRWLTLPIIS